MDFPAQPIGCGLCRLVVTLLAVCAVQAALPAAGTADVTPLFFVEGAILDATPGRVLYSTTADQHLQIFDVAGGETTTIPLPEDRRTGGGQLFDGGALVVLTKDVFPYHEIAEFRDGQLTVLGNLNSASSIKVAGQYAIWSDDKTLYRRNLATQTSTVVATDAGNTDNDIAANGDVVYWTSNPYVIRRWRDGTSVQMSQQPAAKLATYPLTDGNNVVYRVTNPCCNNDAGTVAFSDGEHETILDSQRSR